MPRRIAALSLRPRAAAPRGFTLVEMVIVLVLLGILFSFAAPRLTGMAPRYRLRTYARQIAGTVEKVRVAAIIRGKTTGIRYLLDQVADRPQSFEMLPPAPIDYPDQPLDERTQGMAYEVPTGVRIRGVVLPGQRGGMITRGVVNIAFTPSGTTGSHIVILEVDGEDGAPVILSVKYNTISGIVDFLNTDGSFQHYEA